MGKSTNAFKLTTPLALLATDELLDFDDELLDLIELATEETDETDETDEEITEDAIELEFDDFTLDDVEATEELAPTIP
jgi:hypothetical protein